MLKIDMERPECCDKCPMYGRGLLRRGCRLDGGPGACPLLDDGPRVIPYDEAMAGEVCWIEWRQTGDVEMVMPMEITGEMYLQSVSEIHRASDVAPRKGDGRLFRFWDRRPTEEQREEEEWDDQGGGYQNSGPV